jgi:hypothetical protein
MKNSSLHKMELARFPGLIVNIRMAGVIGWAHLTKFMQERFDRATMAGPTNAKLTILE